MPTSSGRPPASGPVVAQPSEAATVSTVRRAKPERWGSARGIRTVIGPPRGRDYIDSRRSLTLFRPGSKIAGEPFSPTREVRMSRVKMENVKNIVIIAHDSRKKDLLE